MEIIQSSRGSNLLGLANQKIYPVKVIRRVSQAAGVSSWQYGNIILAEVIRPQGLTKSRTCITIALFACMGGDFVIVTAGEARHPRKDLAPVARFMYLVPVGLYIFSSFLV